MSNVGQYNPSDMSLNSAADAMSDWDGLGDALSSFTSDISTLGSDISSVGEDVSSLGSDISDIVSQAGSAISSFLSPGGLTPPEESDGDGDVDGGWGAGQATDPGDTGLQDLPQLPSPSGSPVSQDGGTPAPAPAPTTDPNTPNLNNAPTDSTGNDSTVQTNGSDAAYYNSILSDPNASVEDKVFALLLKLQDKQQGIVNDDLNKATKTADSSGKTSGGGQSNSSEVATQRLQHDMGDLSSLQSTTTQLLQMFHQTRSSTIQNMR